MTASELAVIGPVGGCGAVALCLHELGRHRLGHDGVGPAERWQPWLFRAGVVLAVLIVLPPLGRWAPSELFARSIVDVTLSYAVAPLVLLGAPWRAFAASLGARADGRLDGRDPAVNAMIASSPAEWPERPERPERGGPVRPMLRPVVAVVAFLAVVGVWHLPPVLDASAGSAALWDLEMAASLAAGLVLWSQLVGSGRWCPAWSPLDRIWLVVAVLAGVSVLGASMLFSPGAWYPAFDGGRHALLSASVDQAFAGATLGVVPALPLGGFAWWCFSQWIGHDADDELYMARLVAAARDATAVAPGGLADRFPTEEPMR